MVTTELPQELAKRFREGDPEAFRQLHAQFAAGLLAFSEPAAELRSTPMNWVRTCGCESGAHGSSFRTETFELGCFRSPAIV